MKRLSIIIPVYNVEQYIRTCLESVYRQTLDDRTFEVILVNDGTRDNSFGVITDIVAEHSNIVVAEQENQGLSAARNTGMTRATGDYVLFLDSDDLLVDDSLAALLDDAAGEQADLLIAGFVKMTDEDISGGKTVANEASQRAVKTGSQAFTDDLNPQQCYVWRTLYRRQFLVDNHITFIPGIYFEDVPFTTECYLKAAKCITTDRIFYIYRQRPGSIVSAINKRKVMDFHHVMARLWEMQDLPLTAAERTKLMETLFTTFSIELWYITHHQTLLAERREIVADLKQRVPDLRFTNGRKQRLVSWCYRHMPLSYIRLRSLISS